MSSLLAGALGAILSVVGIALTVLFVGTVIMAPYTIVVLAPLWWWGRRVWRHLHAPRPAAPVQAPATWPTRSSMDWEEDL